MRRFPPRSLMRLRASVCDIHWRRMGGEPEHFDERAAGLAMLGTILFCAAVGGGVGIFFEQPVIGAIGGALIGILLGFWLVPRLMRDWD